MQRAHDVDQLGVQGIRLFIPRQIIVTGIQLIGAFTGEKHFDGLGRQLRQEVVGHGAAHQRRIE